jgi:hypothetical protein
VSAVRRKNIDAREDFLGVAVGLGAKVFTHVMCAFAAGPVDAENRRANLD